MQMVAFGGKKKQEKRISSLDFSCVNCDFTKKPINLSDFGPDYNHKGFKDLLNRPFSQKRLGKRELPSQFANQSDY